MSPMKRLEKYNYAENDYLKSNEIAAYVFKYDTRSKGYKRTEVEMTAEDGISDE